MCLCCDCKWKIQSFEESLLKWLDPQQGETIPALVCSLFLTRLLLNKNRILPANILRVFLFVVAATDSKSQWLIILLVMADKVY